MFLKWIALVGVVGCLFGRPADADTVVPTERVTTWISVRDKPMPGATEVGRLAPGDSAKKIDTTRYWHKVELLDGTIGYVARTWTRVVEDMASGDDLVVTFIDIGEGDAILLQVGAIDILVDAGPRGAWKRGLEATLASINGPLEALYITHPHDDHYGGGKDVLFEKDVKAVYTNGEKRGKPRDPDSLSTWDDFVGAVKTKGLALQSLDVGKILLPAPGLKVTVLATGSESGGAFKDTANGADINNDSLVLMVEFGSRRLLLTGDLETAADSMLVKRYCENGSSKTCPKLRADVLKVPHHGSASFDEDFFVAVGAPWAVISAEFESEKHHLPRTETIDSLRTLRSKIISTSADGTENAVLKMTRAGVLKWTKMPSNDIFGWRKTASGHDKVSYPQGQ